MEHSATTFIDKAVDDKFYEVSYANQTDSKPLPQKAKKTCYNYRCKYLKKFTFDEREKTRTAVWSQFMSTNATGEDSTRSKSFYDRQIDL